MQLLSATFISRDYNNRIMLRSQEDWTVSVYVNDVDQGSVSAPIRGTWCDNPEYQYREWTNQILTLLPDLMGEEKEEFIEELEIILPRIA
ncbi:hypothetical protein C4565_00575 [Candidatus Parcubacteria bacterium]|nr:MAG: hypothetical protein C4565_00575 [Candidatus Parcubacteria bacterium]